MIVVCGEALMDVIQNDDGTSRAMPGGGPFNTARALARLDVPAAFLGHLSEDAVGRELAALLQGDGVSLEFASYGPEVTTSALVELDAQRRPTFRFEVEGTSAPNVTAAMIPTEFGPEVEALCMGSLGLALEPMADTLVELAGRERDKRLLMLDPNVRPGAVGDADYRERLLHVIGASTIVKASDADLAWLYPGLEYERAAAHILDEGAGAVVVTLGAEGAFGTTGDTRIHVASPRVPVVDTIGAGDAFGAGLLAWLHDHDCISRDLRLEESDLKAALDYACLAAAITCTRAGADPPRKAEMNGV